MLPARIGIVVRLEWTPCHYGGTRAWFHCPTSGCGRRVAILYLGDAVFACRHCYQLGYQSQREAPYLRAIYRAQAIRIKLGGSADLNTPFPWKPEGMRLSTYQRLRRLAEEMEARSWPKWFPLTISQFKSGDPRSRSGTSRPRQRSDASGPLQIKSGKNFEY